MTEKNVRVVAARSVGVNAGEPLLIRDEVRGSTIVLRVYPDRVRREEDDEIQESRVQEHDGTLQGIAAAITALCPGFVALPNEGHVTIGRREAWEGLAKRALGNQAPGKAPALELPTPEDLVAGAVVERDVPRCRIDGCEAEVPAWVSSMGEELCDKHMGAEKLRVARKYGAMAASRDLTATERRRNANARGKRRRAAKAARKARKAARR